MTTWQIKSEKAYEKEAVGRWGREEWTRRQVVVSQKCDELEAEDGWEARCVIGTQFEPLARMLSQGNWDKFILMPVSKWRRLVERVVRGS